MTSLYRTKVKCTCGEENIVVYYASICTWMEGQDWIQNLLEGRLNGTQCKKCGTPINVNSSILINCIKGMFSVNPRDDPENLKRLLKEHGLLRENGTLVDEFTERIIKAKAEMEHKFPSASSINASNSLKSSTDTSNLPSTQEKPSPPPPPPPPFSSEAIKEREKKFEEIAANKNLSPSDKEKLKEYLERKQKRDFNLFENL